MNLQEKNRIAEAVHEKSNETLALLQQLIRTRSGPPPTSEKECQQIVEDKLRSLAVQLDVFEVTEMLGLLLKSPSFGKVPNPETWYKDRPVVVGKIKGTGGGRSLILNGHMDTVGVEPRNLWRHDPFAAEVSKGRIYGVGAADMKGGMASVLMALDTVVGLGYQLKGDLIVESVIDEEGGANGTRACITKGYKADAAIVPEPTELSVCPTQQGWLMLRVKVFGERAHVGLAYEGVSAFEKAETIHNALTDLASCRSAYREHPLYTGKYPITTPISVGVVRAGDWVNTVPAECTLEACILTLPNEDAEQVRREVEHYIRGVALQDTWLKNHPPEIEWWGSVGRGIDQPVDHDIIKILSPNVEYVTGKKAEISGMIAGGDMNQLVLEAGIPSVMFGPGSVRVSHHYDEFVEVSQVIDCTKVLAMTILDWCGYG